MATATLEKETISRSTPSNLEGLSEVKSDIKKNRQKYDKTGKSEKKLKRGGKKIFINSKPAPASGETESQKAMSSLTTVMCNDCQMIASHDLDFFVPHKTCICSLINMQSICCIVGYNAWVERLPYFAIFLPNPQCFSTYDVLSKKIWTNRTSPYFLASHTNAIKCKILNINQSINYTLI